MLEKIKDVLDSGAGLVEITDSLGRNVKKAEDYRFELIKKYVDSVENKDDSFYAELIKLLSNSIDSLYDKDIDAENYTGIVYDLNGELIEQDDIITYENIYELEVANREFSDNLFNYVCDILEKNKDVKLDYETLEKLFNRNPKELSLCVEETYVFRMFDFERLAKILKENQTLQKSNINIDEIYKLLILTSQVSNRDVFGNVISPEDFKNNHAQIDELFEMCGAGFFVDVTNTIINNFDKEFDRLSYVKKRTSKNFPEKVILELLRHNNSDNFSLVHQILTDEDIQINYGYSYADYFGHGSLREDIALSENRTIIKDMMSKDNDYVRNCYWHGERYIPLYVVYAIAGDYENALKAFQKKYKYNNGFIEDNKDGLEKNGISYGDFYYKDSLVRFLENMCYSLNKDEVDYSIKKDYITRILNSDNVKFINYEEILPILKDELNEDDYKLLFNSIMEKRNNGSLKFITVEETTDFSARYTISIATEEEIQATLSELNEKPKTKSLNNKKQKGN